MVIKNKTVEWGGLTVKCADLYFGVNTPRDAGTKLSATEMGYIASATTTPTASKFTVANSSGQTAWRRRYIDDGAAVVLTAADSGGVIYLDKTDGSQTTLPAPAVGLNFKFVWAASWASGNQKIITDAGTTFLKGTVSKFDTDTLTDPLSQETFNGTSHIALLVDAATDGGLIGGWLEFNCVSSTIWHIHGMINHSGNVSAAASTS
jgi:hypothetical protein